MDKRYALKVAARAIHDEETSIKASISDSSIEGILLAVDILTALPKDKRNYDRYFDKEISKAQTAQETSNLSNNKWVIGEISDLMKKIDGKLRSKRRLYESQ